MAPASAEIPMRKWEEHFKKTLNTQGTDTAIEPRRNTIEQTPFIIQQEVKEVILAIKSKKASGPDGIYNENLHIITPMDIALQ